MSMFEVRDELLNSERPEGEFRLVRVWFKKRLYVSERDRAEIVNWFAETTEGFVRDIQACGEGVMGVEEGREVNGGWEEDMRIYEIQEKQNEEESEVTSELTKELVRVGF